MKKLLQINSSLFSNGGQSSQLANHFVAAWRELNPQGQLTVRDLAKDQMPHLSAERFQAFLTQPADRNAEQAAVVDFSDTLIAELREADTIVLGLPMYNFGVPSMLKAYFDHIARVGVTFRYTEKGPEGLLKGKRAYIFAARGGKYAGTPLDTQSDYVRAFLNFLGIADVEFIYAEGLAMGDASKEGSLKEAHEVIARIVRHATEESRKPSFAVA
jgi:FMN-dependent NADH-azoreductase